MSTDVTCPKCGRTTPTPQARSVGKCYHCSAPLDGAPEVPAGLSDAELIGLSALLTAHAAAHASELAFWQAVGVNNGHQVPSFGSWAWERIENELKRRGVQP